MDNRITGTCLCGGVEYSVENEFLFLLLCHCEQCRRISGSSHAANLFSDTNSLVWTKGEKNIGRFDFPERDFTKAFCKTCGCGLPYRSKSSDRVIVPAGTLNSEPEYAQKSKVFLAECTKWGEHDLEAGAFAGFPA